MAPTKNARYVATEQQEEYDEATDHAYADEQPADYEAEAEPRCVSCGELLAWHEVRCEAVPAPAAEEAEPVIVAHTPTLTFAYELGYQVHPAPAGAARTIVWRGQLKERHPVHRHPVHRHPVHRVPVYRLDDGYWDCYREEDLLVA